MNDVLVIGSGPGGSTAARLLAEAGLRVLMLERARFPRPKPCGGGLTSRAAPLLPPGWPDYVRARPLTWRFESAGRRTEVATPEPYSLIVYRPEFDAWLASAAVKAGAILHEGEAVETIAPAERGWRVTTRAAIYQARYLVGADGALGASARLLGLSRPRNGAAVEGEIPVSAEEYADWRDRVAIGIDGVPWGYAWVIPRAPILNLGVASFRAGRVPLRALALRWIAQQLGPGRARAEDLAAYPLPYRIRSAPLARERALLVGDAAGMMDALSGEGIYSALRTAHVAAAVVAEAAANDRDLLAYDRRLKAEVWPELKRAAKLSLLFYPWPHLWAGQFLESPRLIEQYLAVAQGRAAYHTLVKAAEVELWARTRRRRGLINPSERPFPEKGR